MADIRFWEATATLVGCIIGAGIFGLPYMIAKAGFLTGALVIILMGSVVMLVYLYLGEVVLRTEGKHQLTGYAEKYLGRWGKRAMMVSMLVGLYGAMTAYLMGVGAALAAIFGGQPFYYTIAFAVVTAAILLIGLGAVEKSELVTMILIFLTIIIIMVFTVPFMSAGNLGVFDIKNFFMPFGVVLFAYLGFIAVPEASHILKEKKQKMRKAIIAGVVVPMAVYLVFALIVVGSIGLENFELMNANSRIATIALGTIISPKLFVLANIFAVMTMFTSFIAIGFALKEMFVYDYRMPEKRSWLLTCSVPLVIALAGFTDFIEVINVSGVFAGGLDAILIILMFHKAKDKGSRRPEYTIREFAPLSFLLAALFIAGAVFLVF